MPEVLSRGQAGLLDVVPSPRFATDRTIFFSYSEPTPRGGRTAVARAVLDDTSLSDVRVIFRQAQDPAGGNHWGSRLVFAPDGQLFITLGDRFDHRDRAQDLDSHFGKIVRIEAGRRGTRRQPVRQDRPARFRRSGPSATGTCKGPPWIPPPAASGPPSTAPKAATRSTSRLAGRNYGWPVITHGVDYSGAKIGIGSENAGMEQPVLHWTPSIAPSGLAFYDADRFPRWQGNLFAGSLKNRMLVRMEMRGDRVIHQEQLLGSLGQRIRDVRQGPDGYLYLLTDDRNGRLLRLEPIGS